MIEAPTYEEIASTHYQTTRPAYWASLTTVEQMEFVTLLADEVRAHISMLLDSRTPQPRAGETAQQADARIATARMHLENEAIREYLLPAPPTGPTDPDIVEGLEEDYRMGIRTRPQG